MGAVGVQSIDNENNTFGSATGFALSSNGLIVTNYHVVDGATSIFIRGINGDFSKTYNAKVIITDKNNDLAILKIEDNLFSTLGNIPYNIDINPVKTGETIFVLG